MFHGIAQLNVAVAGLSPGGLHPQCHHIVVVGHKLQSFFNLLTISVLVMNHVVGRGKHHCGTGRARSVKDTVDRPNSTGNRISLDGLIDDMVVGHLRKLLFHDIDIFTIGIDIDIFLRKYAPHPVIGLLQLGTPHTEEVNKLFREAFTAVGP